jgi:hypothetical protein
LEVPLRFLDFSLFELDFSPFAYLPRFGEDIRVVEHVDAASEFLVGSEVVLLEQVDFGIAGVDAEHLQAGLAIAHVQFLSQQVQGGFSVLLGLVYLPALLLHVGQFVVVVGVLPVTADLLNIVLLGFVELAGQQVDVALVFDFAH